MNNPRKVYTVFSQKMPINQHNIGFQDTISFFDEQKAMAEADKRINKYYPPPNWIVGILQSMLEDDINIVENEK